MSGRMEPATRSLIQILKLACSGELGASLAYRGHAHSLRDPEEKAAIKSIEREEREHRAEVTVMLASLGAAPSPWREILMRFVGHTVAILCHCTGWFMPMYGAGLVESRNVREYEEAARRAEAAGHPELVDDLLRIADVEAKHEDYLRLKCEGHWMSRVFPMWRAHARTAGRVR